MPINGVSGRVRVLRTKKARTGYVTSGSNSTYPKDTDTFVAKKIDGWSQDELDVYGARPIDGAKFEKPDDQPFAVGKALRGMLPFEADALSPTDGRELVLELLNRSWSQSKLRCSGNGGENEPGQAVCRDEAYKNAIVKATKKAASELEGGGWTVVCRGPKCPMWHTNRAENKLAGCHGELRLRFLLLHPTTDPENPNYLKQMGWVEIASGSSNAMWDIQSGFAAIKSLVGRTALIPFTLRRVPRTLLPEGKRVVKATLMVDYDHDEVIRFGYSDPKLSLVRPEVRKQLMAQRRELLELAKLEADFDSFRDIQPQPPQLQAHQPFTAPTSKESKESKDEPAATPTVDDRDEVVDQGVREAGPAPLSEEELNRYLSQGERNELKVLCGGVPGDTTSLANFRELVRMAYREYGDWEPQGENVSPPLSSLKVRHAIWIREALKAEASASGQEAQGPTGAAQQHEEGHSAETSASPDRGSDAVQEKLL